MFNGSIPDDTSSPIDQFIANTDAINRIYLRQYQQVEPNVGSPPRSAESLATTEGGDLAAASSEGAADTRLANIPDQDAQAEATEGTSADEGDTGSNVEAVSETPPAIVSTPISIPPELGAVAVLGYMSAVESYFRALLRNLIDIDDHVRILAEPMEISFAAARYHKKELLAEALTEGMSFAGEQNVADMLRKRIGIKGNFPVEIEKILKEFKKVCEIRHCCVHRFGRLGSKNAVSLGMVQHQEILEKPFSPTLDDLQTIADLLRTFVKSLNNFIFRSLVERIGMEGVTGEDGLYDRQWSGDIVEDSGRFNAYYELFASKNDTPPSPDSPSVYAGLLGYFEAKSTGSKGGTRHPSRSGNIPDKPVGGRAAPVASANPNELRTESDK
jgi:hypothetical protein